MEIEFIKKTLTDILLKLNVVFEMEILNDSDINATIFLIKTDESNILIGYKGVTLSAISHIVRRIVDKKFNIRDTGLYFIIDINNYHSKKIEELKANAKMLAERAKYFKSSVEMEPLPPYERMIIHAIFTNSHDFETSSCGEGDKRRVVIKYIAD